MTTPAPEPVEVPAAELAAAERRLSELAAHWGNAGDLQAFAGREPYWTCARHAAVLLAEYDRRLARITKFEGMVCTCHQGQAMEAQLDRLTARIAELESELSAEQDACDELLAESGGVSSPPFEGGPPRGN